MLQRLQSCYKNFNFILAEAFQASTDPFEILGDSSTNKVLTELGTNGEAFSFSEVAFLLRQVILYGGVLGCVASLLGIIVVYKDTRMIGEKKREIYHRLLIVFLCGAAVSFFNAYKAFLDKSFGFTG